MTVTVSVVIPCYNHAHFVHLAIESILAQTFTEWEAIIVDDGSTDNTAEAAALFTDPRVRYIRQDNQGLSAARNTGIGAAQGKYLAFLDADDEWYPQFLERCVTLLTQDDTLGGVYSLASLIDPQGVVLPQVGGQIVPVKKFRRRLLEGGFFPVHAALVKAELLRQVGVFDIQLTSLEDWDLWLRFSEHYAMQGIPETLACYRVYPGSMSTNAVRMHTNRCAVLTKYFGSLESTSDDESYEKLLAYGFVYRCTAMDYIQQGNLDEGWRYLERAVTIWPNLLKRVDTFYELVCGDQPRGHRGHTGGLDIEKNGAEMLKRLDNFWVGSTSQLVSLRHVAYSNAYLALAMLSDQAGQWSLACHYILRAVRRNPGFLFSVAVMRRLLKLCVYRIFKKTEKTKNQTNTINNV